MLFWQISGNTEVCFIVIRILISHQNFDSIELPLGNQTSQWFALYYLDSMDRLIKEKMRIKYYVRYMDDGVLVHESKEYLNEVLCQMKGKAKAFKALGVGDAPFPR